ncbi:MAG: hypothetical protein JWR35_2527 [Marmoricola sp.]|jgi:very-short-patch-repair endonuclease|nr:hypothetical protein [Marmoricola sp.]
MFVDEALQRHGGLCRAHALVRLTSRSAVRSALDRGEIVRVGRGRYALPTADLARRVAHALSGVVSHASAAAYWGWELKCQPERPVVTVPRNRNVAARRRVGVDVRWRNIPVEDISTHQVTMPAATVIDCAVTLPFDQALAIADSALRSGQVDLDELVQRAGRLSSTGRTEAFRVIQHADGRAAGAFESVLRAIAIGVAGLSVEPQVEIIDGSFYARPDLVDETLRIVIEANSFEYHGSRKLMKRDCERYVSLVTREWTVLWFTWEHVMFDPEWVASALAAVASTKRRAALRRKPQKRPESGRVPVLRSPR